jgi:hypothetical protein
VPDPGVDDGEQLRFLDVAAQLEIEKQSESISSYCRFKR